MDYNIIKRRNYAMIAIIWCNMLCISWLSYGMVLENHAITML